MVSRKIGITHIRIEHETLCERASRRQLTRAPARVREEKLQQRRINWRRTGGKWIVGGRRDALERTKEAGRRNAYIESVYRYIPLFDAGEIFERERENEKESETDTPYGEIIILCCPLSDVRLERVFPKGIFRRIYLYQRILVWTLCKTSVRDISFYESVVRSVFRQSNYDSWYDLIKMMILCFFFFFNLLITLVVRILKNRL